MQNITVIGAGTMGHGIAETFALYGYDVNLFDMSAEMLKKGIESIREELEILAFEGVIDEKEIDEVILRIKPCNEIKEAVEDADYVIESIIENLEVKQKLFKQLDELCKKGTIFASNTSSLKLSDMIRDVSESRRDKCIINHFYNPSHIIPIIEITLFGDTSQETFDKVKVLYEGVEKQVVKVVKEVPGLIANRIQQAVAREVFSLIQMEVGSPEDIDKALKFGPAFRYCSTGQLEIADFGGIDIWKIVGDNLLSEMDNSQMANPLLSDKVKAGKLGIKTNEGFYKYDSETIDKVKRNYTKKLITQLKISKLYI